MPTPKPPRSTAELIAYDASGSIVSRKTLSFDDFYGGENELIDSSEYRRQHGIARITGKIYDSRRKLVEEFDNEYSQDGRYKHGRAVFEDGTVQEN